MDKETLVMLANKLMFTMEEEEYEQLLVYFLYRHFLFPQLH